MLSTLQSLLKNPQSSARDVWCLFRELYGGRFHSSVIQNALTGQQNMIILEILDKIVRDWSEGTLPTGVPTPALSIRTFINHDLMRWGYWPRMIVSMLQSVISGHSLSDATSHANDGDFQQRLEELLAVWELLFSNSARVDMAMKTAPLSLGRGNSRSKRSVWPFLPSKSELQERSIYLPEKAQGYRQRLLRNWNMYHHLPSPACIADSAVITFAILSRQVDQSVPPRNSSNNERSFLYFLAHVLSGVKLNVKVVAANMTQWRIDKEVVQRLLEDWDGLTRNASALADSLDSEEPIISPGPLQLKGQVLVNALDRRIKSRDLTGVHIFWQLFREHCEQSAPQRNSSVVQRDRNNTSQEAINEEVAKLHPKEMEGFVKAYMALKQPEKAIKIWYMLKDIQGKASTGSWWRLLQGCMISSDWEVQETLWSKMLGSGMQPNLDWWFMRISTLVDAKMWERTAEACQMLLQHGTVESDPERLSHIIELAIAYLRHGGQYVPAQRVLSVAYKFGVVIKPETYNSFVLDSLRSGESERVDAWQRFMATGRTPANLTCYLQQLNVMFREGSLSSPNALVTDQQAGVATMMNHMEDSNLKVDAHACSVLIKSLLQEPARHDGIRAVLAYMAAQNIKVPENLEQVLVELGPRRSSTEVYYDFKSGWRDVAVS